MNREIYFQGDVMIERTEDLSVSGMKVPLGNDGELVIAEGEETGHRHAFYGGNVTMYQDSALCRGIQDKRLYIGHINVEGPSAMLEHDEHAPIALSEGTYRISRQREFDSHEARIVRD